MTGVEPARGKVQVGISVDQIAAQALGKETQFASLEIATEHNGALGGVLIRVRRLPCPSSPIRGVSSSASSGMAARSIPSPRRSARGRSEQPRHGDGPDRRTQGAARPQRQSQTRRVRSVHPRYRAADQEATAELSLAHTLETAVERVAELLAVERIAVYLRADEDRLAAGSRARPRRAARARRRAAARARARPAAGAGRRRRPTPRRDSRLREACGTRRASRASRQRSRCRSSCARR